LQAWENSFYDSPLSRAAFHQFAANVVILAVKIGLDATSRAMEKFIGSKKQPWFSLIKRIAHLALNLKQNGNQSLFSSHAEDMMSVLQNFDLR
jgi:hypothetical protein